jgi:hypothetical protein
VSRSSREERPPPGVAWGVLAKVPTEVRIAKTRTKSVQERPSWTGGRRGRSRLCWAATAASEAWTIALQDAVMTLPYTMTQERGTEEMMTASRPRLFLLLQRREFQVGGTDNDECSPEATGSAAASGNTGYNI